MSVRFDIEQARNEKLIKVKILHCTKITQNKIKKAQWRILNTHILGFEKHHSALSHFPGQLNDQTGS